MRIFSVVLVCVGLVSASWSSKAYCSAEDFKGFYVGGAFGHAMGDIRVKVDPTPGGNDEQENASNLSTRGLTGGAHVGWGNLFFSDRLYVGVEAFAHFLNLTNTTNPTPEYQSHLKTSLRHSLGVDLRVGTPLNDFVLIYGKVGLASSSLKISSSQNLVAGADRTSQDNRNLVGFAPGLGVETLCGPVRVGLSYSHTFYKTFAFSHPGVTNYSFRNLRVGTTLLRLSVPLGGISK